jgi:ribosomal protein L22
MGGQQLADVVTSVAAAASAARGQEMDQETIDGLKTAIADAENNFSLDVDTLIVKEAIIGAGPTMKRHKPRARGSAGAIIKRTSHIFITLAEAPEEDARKKRINVSKKVEA